METATRKADSGRIIGIDLARAIAIIGMVLINYNESIAPSYRGPEWLAGLAGLIPGRAAVTFVLLAGIGMSIMSQGAKQSGDPLKRQRVRHVLLKRAVVLFVSGMLFQTIWIGDILHFYGVFIVAGTLLLFAPSIWLWLAALFLNVGFVVMLLFLDYDAGWNWENLTFTNFWTPIGFVRNLIFNGWFPVFPWLGFLLIGMWVGRLNLRSRTIQRRCMLWGGVIALSAEVASWLLANHIAPKWLGFHPQLSTALFGRGCLPPNPLFALQTCAGAICMVGVCLAIADRFRGSAWLRSLSLSGQYTLSIYIGHIIFGIGPLYLLGYKDISLTYSVPAGLVACAVAITLCSLWQRRFPRGPLEMAMRRITNGKPLPKRVAGST
ncbi:MAG: DUF1624 domain-containing protein [Kiritimatiellae bacterium]|nr:DUF1624 domain-containing protein [Kiritimatiellia bacterium]